jgi:NadR type nicotinamide-nucleotide adenylyltransferase
MTTGLVLETFLPPHRGHQLLLDFAAAYVDSLQVVVATSPGDPIPAAQRVAWLRELAPGAVVLPMAVDAPCPPTASPSDWSSLVAGLRRILPRRPDVVLSSGQDGVELAARLGARHAPFDAPRATAPISEASLRQAPLAHWHDLPDCVRPYYARRIAVVGPESTGKTTLAQRLAAYFGTVWVPEYARSYAEAKRAPLDRSDVEPIARGHRAAEEALARRCDRLLLVDTDAVMTTLYSRIYYGDCPAWIDELAAGKRYDLYLLMAPDVAWVADPQRDLPQRREEFFASCRKALEAKSARFEIIQGDWESRLSHAIEAVRRLR